MTKNIFPVLPENSNFYVAGCKSISLNVDSKEITEQILLTFKFLSDWYNSHLSPNHSKKLEWYSNSIPEMSKRLTQLRSADWRKKNLTPAENKEVLNAFSGDRNAQFFPYDAWIMNGFGIPNNIVGTKLELILFKKAISALYKATGIRFYPEKLPHAIIKIPNPSSELKAHADYTDHSFKDLYHDVINTKTTAEWIEKYGVQCLLHIISGTGSTTALENLDIDTYKILLTMLNPDTAYPGLGMKAEKWEEVSNGPNLFNFYNKNLLEKLNDVLSCLHDKECYHQTKDWILSFDDPSFFLEYLDSHPQQLCVRPVRLSPVSNKPFLVCWLWGFPHGSAKEIDSVRFTMTVPITKDSNKNQILKRAEKRVKAMYHPYMRDDKMFKIPDNGGIVHRHPERIFTYFDEFESFRKLYGSETELNKLFNTY